MATFPVKYIHNNMRGAPQISGTPGTFIAALDAFLITGFGQVTALSVSVNNGIATATLNAGETFAEYCVVLVAGATPEALNGEQRVLTATNSSITWATSAPNGTATGTITIKVAPVGQWEKPFSATNQAVYRSEDPAGSRFYLRVDDTGTQFARVRGFEAMSDISTGSGPFPVDMQASGGGYLLKSQVANATPVRYDWVADNRFILWPIAPGFSSDATRSCSALYGFGDLLPLAPGGDGYATTLNCQWQNQTSHHGYGSFGLWENSNVGGPSLPRALSGLGGAQTAKSRGYISQAGTTLSGRDSSLGPFPSKVDGELKYTRCFVEDGALAPRADVPGLLLIPQSGVSLVLDNRDTVAGNGALAGRKLLSLLVAQSAISAARTEAGVALVDITGPWR